MTEEVKETGEQTEQKPAAGTEPSSQDVGVTEKKEEVKQPEIDYKAEYEKTKKSYEELNSLVGKHATEKDNLSRELAINKEMLARLVGNESKTPVKDNEFELLDDESKFAEAIQTADGVKKVFKLLEKKSVVNTKQTIQEVLNDIAEHGQLYNKYPDLAKPDSEFKKRYDKIIADYDLGGSKKGKVVAAKLVANELAELASAESTIKAVEEAKAGLKAKEDKSHVEINKKGGAAMSKTELTAEQKKAAAKFGLSEEEYASTIEKAKVNAKGHKTYSLDDMIPNKEGK